MSLEWWLIGLIGVTWASSFYYVSSQYLGASSPQLQFVAGTVVASVSHRKNVMRASWVIRSPRSLCSCLVLGGHTVANKMGGFKQPSCPHVFYNIIQHFTIYFTIFTILYNFTSLQFYICLLLINAVVDTGVDGFCDCWITSWSFGMKRIQRLTPAPLVMSNLSSNPWQVVSQYVTDCHCMLFTLTKRRNMYLIDVLTRSYHVCTVGKIYLMSWLASESSMLKVKTWLSNAPVPVLVARFMCMCVYLYIYYIYIIFTMFLNGSMGLEWFPCPNGRFQ